MCIYVCLDCSPPHVNKARYALEVLLDTLGFPYTFVDSEERQKITQGILILYGGSHRPETPAREKLGRILMAESWAKETGQIRVASLSTPEGNGIPVLGKRGDEDVGVAPPAADDTVVINQDLVFSTFFLLSRCEEIGSRTLDRHGRFPSQDSISHTHHFSQRAIINEYLKFLHQTICRIARAKKIPLLRKCYWPGGDKLAVCLTHDVDIIGKWYLYSLVRCMELLKNRQVWPAARTLWSLIKGLAFGRNPALALEQVTSAEDEFSFKSSFYFMVGKPKLKTLLSSDITYDLSKPKILKKAREVSEGGFEVGLHASYGTYLNSGRLLREKEQLESLIGSPVCGLRQHFLRFRIPESWIDQEKCGFLYDTTLGFADKSGYRAGLAFPFWAYDAQSDRRLNLIELPLVAMDRTYSKYLSYSADQIETDIVKTLEGLEDFGGLVTILWHTHMVDELGFPGYPRLYEKLLDFMHRRGYFVAPAKEIARWWTTRRDLKVKGTPAETGKTSWELETSDSFDQLRLELVASGTEAVTVTGCEHEIVRKGPSTIIELRGIKAGVRITLAIQTA